MNTTYLPRREAPNRVKQEAWRNPDSRSWRPRGNPSTIRPTRETTKRKKVRREDAKQGCLSWERERERKTPSPPKLFYSSPISFHLSRTKNSLPLASPVSLPKKKVPNTSSIFRAGSPGLSFTQDTISLDHQRMRSAIWWIERLVAGERLERYSLESRTGR